MLKRKPRQFSFQMVYLEDLVPQDHLLRRIDKYIDFEFIKDLADDLYCPDNGRPAIDPVILFKTLFVGYIYGIRSERRLIEEVKVNIAYRWFIGLDIDEDVPSHSTFSQNRKRRFNEHPELYQQIFDNIVQQAVKHKLITGRVLYTDSTHIKANANKHRWEAAQVDSTPAEYTEELDKAVSEERKKIGKKEFEPKEEDPDGDKREIKKSLTDPDSGYMTRDGKPQGFFYLEHRTVDALHNLIVDAHVTAGNVNDARPYPSRLSFILTHFAFPVVAVGLDAGYKTPYIAKFLKELGIYGVVGYRRPPHPNKELFYPREYVYDKETDTYTCPAKKVIRLATVNRHGYKEYRCPPSQCKECPLKDKCTTGTVKVITRHVWADYLQELDSHRLTDAGKEIYSHRKETVERSFADSKEMHGLRYARFRGIMKMQMQSYLSAACQNMKKIALCLLKREVKMA